MADDFAMEKRRHKPRRRNKETRSIIHGIAAGGETEVYDDEPWMDSSPKWHPSVRYLFEAMKRSVMAQFMTPVDWAQLYLKCEAWSLEFDDKFLGFTQEGTIVIGKAPVPAQVLADMKKTLDGFGGSEAARRSMKILIDPNPDGQAGAQAGNARMSAQKAIVRPARHSIEAGDAEE